MKSYKYAPILYTNITMDHIIEKLQTLDDNVNKRSFKDWTLVEIKQLLDIYLLFSKKEPHLFKLIYSYHECDSWEDIFRDYDMQQIEDKVSGIQVAIQIVAEQIYREQQK